MSDSKKLTMAVNVTIEVDAEGWDMDYGTGLDQAKIREDVKAYVRSLINESASNNLTVKRMQ